MLLTGTGEKPRKFTRKTYSLDDQKGLARGRKLAMLVRGVRYTMTGDWAPARVLFLLI